MRILGASAVLAIAAFHGVASAAPTTTFEQGVRPDGSASVAWIRAISDRHPPPELERLRRGKRKLTAQERSWLMFVKQESSRWTPTLEDLNEPFGTIRAPRAIVLLFGNQGGDDGFTYGTDTICLDLRAWARSYGDPSLPGNADRVRRILSHEYTHLLTKVWSANQRIPRNTPLERTVWELFYEGIGNYHSLSEKWRARDGKASVNGARALETHGPTLVQRLQRLAMADAKEESDLRKGLSSGPFPEKWGALPIALWLSKDESVDPGALRRFVNAGPQGVLPFVRAHLPPALRGAIAGLDVR